MLLKCIHPSGNNKLRATPIAWLKLVAKFYYLTILQNRKLLKKEEIHNSLAILQNHIACVSGWLYMASENQEIVNFLFYKTRLHICWSLPFVMQILNSLHIKNNQAVRVALIHLI
jgi:hypothetical protein